MENTSKEIYKIEYEVVTPTHIGSGESIPKTELGFFAKERIIRRIDVENYFESLPANKIGEISRLIRQAKNEYFNNILKTERLTLDTLKEAYDLRFLYDYREDELNKLREINAYLKNPFFKPYIPGSTLKGWIRTTILSYYLQKITGAKNKLEDFDRKLDGLPRGGKRLYFEKRDMRKVLEDEIFGSDPREDIFKFIILTDTNVISPEHLKLGFINIFHPSQKGQTISFEPLGFSVGAEVLTSGTKLLGKLILDKNLDNFKEEYLSSNNFSGKIRRFILKDLIEGSREENAKKLCDLNNYLSKDIINYNYEHLLKLKEKIESPSLDYLINYYKEVIFPLYKEVKATNNQFLIRLGYGTEWTSKTIGLRILDYFLKKKENPYDFKTFYDRLNQLQLFKGQRMHKLFELTPISRAYIVNHINSPKFPLGWVKASLNNL